MLKALMKKELLQFFSSFRTRGRKGKKTLATVLLTVLLMALMFFSFGAMFFGTADMLLPPFKENGLDWLYFAIMGLFALAIGVVVNVFTANALLYKGKDNDFLLSMPIPASKLLVSKMLLLYLMTVYSAAMVWLPTVLRYNIGGIPSVVGLVLQVLLLFVLSALITVLNCLLGWLVGLLTGRIKNKSLATVLLSLLFIGVYYYFYFKLNDLLGSIIANMDNVASTIKGAAYPLWQFGLGAAGSVPSFLIFTAIVAALFAAACAVLSATLIRIMTYSREGKRTKYKGGIEKRSGVRSALLKKEFRRFTGSATYMLNAGLGLLIALILPIVALIKTNTIREAVLPIVESIGIGGALPLLAAAAVAVIGGLDMFTAPSVSLEGQRIWIIRSLPVDERSVLKAKVDLDLLLNAVPLAFAAISFGVIIRADVPTVLAMLLLVAAFTWFSAELGLMFNLLKPNLDWKNEAAPIKQDMPVLLTMLSNFAASLLMTGAGLLLVKPIGTLGALICAALLPLIGAVLIHRWNMTRGAERFSRLS